MRSGACTRRARRPTSSSASRPCSPPAWRCPEDLDFLVGIYAFGALLGLTIAHAVDRPPALPRARPPAPVPDAAVGRPARGASLPLPAVARRAAQPRGVGQRDRHPRGRALRRASAGWWPACVLYVVYRATQGKPRCRARDGPRAPLLRKEHRRSEARVRLDPRADLRHAARRRHRPDRGAPGRRGARETSTGRGGDDRGAVGLRGADVAADRRAAARGPARARPGRAAAGQGGGGGVRGRRGRDGDGPRARSAGQAIVEEARRRGVEAIVLAAEEPSRIRGGALLGGRGGSRDNFVGEVTKYVLPRPPVPVILTAPPARRTASPEAAPAAGRAARSGPDAESTGLTCPTMFVLIVGAGRVGSAVARSALAAATTSPSSTRTRSRTSGSTSASRRRWEDARRPVHRRPRHRGRGARGGRDRAGRRVHRLHRRRQHEPRSIAQIAQRRFEVPKVIVRVMDPARAALVRRAGAAHDLARPQHAIEMFEQRAREGLADVRHHRRWRQGRLEPRARADRQGPRGHAGREPPPPLPDDRAGARARRPVRRRHRAVGARARRASSAPTSSSPSPATTRTTCSSARSPRRSTSASGSSRASTTPATAVLRAAGRSSRRSRRTDLILRLIEHEVPSLRPRAPARPARRAAPGDHRARGGRRRARGGPARSPTSTLPEGSLIISVLRGGAGFVPKADTVIEAGDEVLLVLDPGLEEAITALLRAPTASALRGRRPPRPRRRRGASRLSFRRPLSGMV